MKTPPAYPGAFCSECGATANTGITTLDVFAKAALKGLLANCGGPVQVNGMTGWGFTNCDAQLVVKLAYDLGEMMMKEKAIREKADQQTDNGIPFPTELV